jgi:hypothetical protein
VAARRLVIVMLVLLGISTLAAALVDPPETDEEEQATEPPLPPQPQGELVRKRIDADERTPEVISIRAGDQLALTVTSGRADEVEIPALGELRFVAPLAPARFDLLAREEGTYAIRLLDAERRIGRIEVTARRDPQALERRLRAPRPGNQ